MAKISKSEKKKIKKTLSKWVPFGTRYIYSLTMFPGFGFCAFMGVAGDVAITGGIGTVSTIVGSLCTGAWGWGVASDKGLNWAGKSSTTNEFTGQKVVGTGPAVKALGLMAEKAKNVFNEMSQKPESEHEPYIKELKEIEHDAQVIKPLYSVFNKAGQEVNKYEFQLRKAEVKKVIVQEVDIEELNISDITAPTRKIKKLGQ